MHTYQLRRQNQFLETRHAPGLKIINQKFGAMWWLLDDFFSIDNIIRVPIMDS